MVIFEQFVKDPSLGISTVAILIMIYCLWLVFTLKSEVPGGVIGRQWTVVSWLVVLFTIGYFATPFFRELPPASLHTIVSVIFLFGAIYVVVTVKMIFRIIKIMSE